VGSVALAIVIVYLLPLIIIAFSYNVLTAEKESGTLRLLAAQPMSLAQWLLQKLSLRFLCLFVLVAGELLLVSAVLGLDIMADFPAFMRILGLILAYMLFWFSLAFLVNLWVGSSAKNALSMLGLWVLFVLLMPSVLNQLGNTLYPMPSRTLMINEMRIKKAEVSQKQDEILDNFLRDHPEYAINDTSQSRTFWHRYMASQRLLKDELQPVVGAFEVQLDRQQDWIDKYKWLSPAVITQESLNQIAGTSTGDYESFRSQVIAFAQSWREYFMPFLYNNREFSQKDYANLPSFQYVQEKNTHSRVILALGLMSCVLFGAGLLVAKKAVSEGIIL